MYTELSPLDKLTLSRMKERPTALDYIERIFNGFIELHGDRGFKDDPSIVGGIAKFNGIPVTVIGQQKGRDIKRSEEHTSELQSRQYLVCRLLLDKTTEHHCTSFIVLYF